MWTGDVLARDDDRQIQTGVCDVCGTNHRYKYGQCKKCTDDYVRNYHAKLSSAYAKTPIGKANAKASQARRRTKKTGAGGSHTRGQFKEICRHYDCHCLRCGKQFPIGQLNADHVVSVANGGSSDIENIQPLCKPCNSSKGAKNTDYRDKVEWDKFGKPVFWWQDGLQI